MSDKVEEIFTDRIQDPKDPMRSELDRAALFELADNIKQNGLINPITVRPLGDMFEVVAGHRRLASCKIAGIIKIPCVIRTLDDNAAFAIMAAENLEREDVDPVDEAAFITRYIEQTHLSPAEVAKTLRRSVQYVETRLAVGSMPDYMKEPLREGTLKLGAALALAQIADENMRRVWVEMAVRDGISVAQAEYWLHGWQIQQLPGAAASDLPPQGEVAAAPKSVMFECAIDGQKYDARQFRTIMVYEGNIGTFNDIVRELRAIPSPESVSPAETPPSTR